jgi:peptidoglycan/LPS O-acetylase OafA/YrhL
MQKAAGGVRQTIQSGADRLAKINRFLRGMTIALVVLALALGSAMLAEEAGMCLIPRLSRGALSAAPLLLVGVALLILQPVIRPRSKELLKNVLLAATFILWGIVQLIPQNALSVKLGSVVVALYVLDLAWAILLGVSSA